MIEKKHEAEENCFMKKKGGDKIDDRIGEKSKTPTVILSVAKYLKLTKKGEKE